jgi:RNA polymerase sigma-70 factor (ECF subfamily)
VKPPVPETRNSLILRLPDKGDVEAWGQFVSIYEPLVYRLARAKGFQHADAQEIVQEVLVAVSRAVQRWTPDPARGRFRDWLFRIARNLMINFLTRRKHLPIGAADSRIAELLENAADPNCDESATFDLEYRRELFRWAADQVRGQVKQRTWSAFWKTSVDGRAIAEVAGELEMSVGAVHIARCRVLGRLREAVKRLEPSGEE